MRGHNEHDQSDKANYVANDHQSDKNGTHGVVVFGSSPHPECHPNKAQQRATKDQRNTCHEDPR